jgi:hypothetical protein
LNESLGFAVCLWCIGFGPQVLDFEPAQCLCVAARSEAATIVSHATLHLDDAYDYLSSAHVAMIGAGITGITTAYNLVCRINMWRATASFFLWRY